MDQTHTEHGEPAASAAPAGSDGRGRARADRASQAPQRAAGQGRASGAALPAAGRASAATRRHRGGFIALGPLDAQSLLGALAASAAFCLLAFTSFALSRFDTAFATIWLPNAAAVAFLLRARLSNELAFYACILAAGMLANGLAGHDPPVAAIYALANIANIAVVTGLTRTTSGALPDMSELGTLARFVIAGGLIGPAVTTAIASAAMGPDQHELVQAASAWFLTESLGMVLIVPTALLLCDAASGWRAIRLDGFPEKVGLLVASIGCLFLVFDQSAYPLLFLILPLTLLHAFRLGSLGTAIHVTLVAAIAITMTWAGKGPIVEASASREVQMHLIQAFLAANFLTGLPFAAILAGRDRMLKELEAGKQRLDLLASTISDAVLRYDLADMCTYASPSVAEVLGEPASAYLGRSMLERTHKDAHERIEEAKARLVSGESQKERFTYRRLLDSAAGRPIFIEAECALEKDPVTGLDQGIIVSARDVTERVELELLLTRARRKAEKAASAKTEFLANMSHEIRTPMNGVLGFAELMLQGELDREQRRNAEMIVRSGRSMMLLLNDILDLSKAEAGQIAIDPAPVDLAATLEECLALHRPAAQEKGLRIELAPAHIGAAQGRAPGFEKRKASAPQVLTDGLRLRQIVLNLVGNAIKFTQAGSIRVTYRVSEHETEIRVEDTGIGIGAARLETIFLPFAQEEGSTTRRFGGTGLGLSISRQLAELLGGTLAGESRPGVGSVFTLRLPTTLVGISEAPSNERDAQEASGREAHAPIPLEIPARSRILLVEDHDVNRLLAAEMLKRCGQNVAIAHDGNEAIAMVIDSVMRERPFDLVLMDVHMPGCDGHAATRAIREEGIGPDRLPIIALTANAFREDVAAARAAGMQAHLAKPLRFAELAHALQRWLPTQIVETPMEEEIAEAPLGEPCEIDRDHGCGCECAPPEEERDEAGIAAGLSSGSEAPCEPAAAAARAVNSPLQQKRWQARRRETIAAVREALTGGRFGAFAEAGTALSPLEDGAKGKRAPLAAPPSAALEEAGGAGEAERSRLISLVHKLAGTAAIFGEARLGECAGELERALKAGSGRETLETLADEMLTIAQGSIGEVCPAARAAR